MRTQRYRELRLDHFHLHRGLLDGRRLWDARELLGELAFTLLRLCKLTLEQLELRLETTFGRGGQGGRRWLLDRRKQAGVLLFELCDATVEKMQWHQQTNPSGRFITNSHGP